MVALRYVYVLALSIWFGGIIVIGAIVSPVPEQALRRFFITSYVSGVLVLTNLSTVVQQYGQILQFGGTPSWTEAVYELHETLEERESSRVIVLDWGIAMQLQLLSRDRLPLQEAPQPAGGDKYFIETIGQGLREPGTVFVGYAPSAASVNPRTRELLDQAARDAGRRLHRVKQIRDRQTRPRFEILEAE